MFSTIAVLTCDMSLIKNIFIFLQSSSHGGGDQELVSRMKSLELENQTLHKGVFPSRLTFSTVFMVLHYAGSKWNR